MSVGHGKLATDGASVLHFIMTHVEDGKTVATSMP
jgi:hypothetical protein